MKALRASAVTFLLTIPVMSACSSGGQGVDRGSGLQPLRADGPPGSSSADGHQGPTSSAPCSAGAMGLPDVTWSRDRLPLTTTSYDLLELAYGAPGSEDLRKDARIRILGVIGEGSLAALCPDRNEIVVITFNAGAFSRITRFPISGELRDALWRAGRCGCVLITNDQLLLGIANPIGPFSELVITVDVHGTVGSRPKVGSGSKIPFSPWSIVPRYAGGAEPMWMGYDEAVWAPEDETTTSHGWIVTVRTPSALLDCECDAKQCIALIRCASSADCDHHLEVMTSVDHGPMHPIARIMSDTVGNVRDCAMTHRTILLASDDRGLLVLDADRLEMHPTTIVLPSGSSIDRLDEGHAIVWNRQLSLFTVLDCEHVR